MGSTNLLIVFAKNAEFGKVKTRLANTLGNRQALEVYGYLFEHTQCIVQQLKNCDVHVYFSEWIDEASYKGKLKFIQRGNDLGERMSQAFEAGFKAGYKRIVGIGTDLPDLTGEIINEALSVLDFKDAVFGPAEDGGYYLIGMSQPLPCIFENKMWSTENLLLSTLDELNALQRTVHLLESKNDIDTYEDFVNSTLAEKMPHIKPIN